MTSLLGLVEDGREMITISILLAYSAQFAMALAEGKVAKLLAESGNLASNLWVLLKEPHLSHLR